MKHRVIREATSQFVFWECASCCNVGKWHEMRLEGDSGQVWGG